MAEPTKNPALSECYTMPWLHKGIKIRLCQIYLGAFKVLLLLCLPWASQTRSQMIPINLMHHDCEHAFVHADLTGSSVGTDFYMTPRTSFAPGTPPDILPLQPPGTRFRPSRSALSRDSSGLARDSSASGYPARRSMSATARREPDAAAASPAAGKSRLAGISPPAAASARQWLCALGASPSARSAFKGFRLPVADRFHAKLSHQSLNDSVLTTSRDLETLGTGAMHGGTAVYCNPSGFKSLVLDVAETQMQRMHSLPRSLQAAMLAGGNRTGAPGIAAAQLQDSADSAAGIFSFSPASDTDGATPPGPSHHTSGASAFPAVGNHQRHLLRASSNLRESRDLRLRDSDAHNLYGSPSAQPPDPSSLHQAAANCIDSGDWWSEVETTLRGAQTHRVLRLLQVPGDGSLVEAPLKLCIDITTAAAASHSGRGAVPSVQLAANAWAVVVDGEAALHATAVAQHLAASITAQMPQIIPDDGAALPRENPVARPGSTKASASAPVAAEANFTRFVVLIHTAGLHSLAAHGSVKQVSPVLSRPCVQMQLSAAALFSPEPVADPRGHDKIAITLPSVALDVGALQCGGSEVAKGRLATSWRFVSSHGQLLHVHETHVEVLLRQQLIVSVQKQEQPCNSAPAAVVTVGDAALWASFRRIALLLHIQSALTTAQADAAKAIAALAAKPAHPHALAAHGSVPGIKQPTIPPAASPASPSPASPSPVSPNAVQEFSVTVYSLVARVANDAEGYCTPLAEVAVHPLTATVSLDRGDRTNSAGSSPQCPLKKCIKVECTVQASCYNLELLSWDCIVDPWPLNASASLIGYSPQQRQLAAASQMSNGGGGAVDWRLESLAFGSTKLLHLTVSPSLMLVLQQLQALQQRIEAASSQQQQQHQADAAEQLVSSFVHFDGRASSVWLHNHSGETVGCDVVHASCTLQRSVPHNTLAALNELPSNGFNGPSAHPAGSAIYSQAAASKPDVSRLLIALPSLGDSLKPVRLDRGYVADCFPLDTAADHPPASPEAHEGSPGAVLMVAAVSMCRFGGRLVTLRSNVALRNETDMSLDIGCLRALGSVPNTLDTLAPGQSAWLPLHLLHPASLEALALRVPTATEDATFWSSGVSVSDLLHPGGDLASPRSGTGSAAVSPRYGASRIAATCNTSSRLLALPTWHGCRPSELAGASSLVVSMQASHDDAECTWKIAVQAPIELHNGLPVEVLVEFAANSAGMLPSTSAQQHSLPRVHIGPQTSLRLYASDIWNSCHVRFMPLGSNWSSWASLRGGMASRPDSSAGLVDSGLASSAAHFADATHATGSSKAAERRASFSSAHSSGSLADAGLTPSSSFKALSGLPLLGRLVHPSMHTLYVRSAGAAYNSQQVLQLHINGGSTAGGQQLRLQLCCPLWVYNLLPFELKMREPDASGTDSEDALTPSTTAVHIPSFLQAECAAAAESAASSRSGVCRVPNSPAGVSALSMALQAPFTPVKGSPQQPPHQAAASPLRLPSSSFGTAQRSVSAPILFSNEPGIPSAPVSPKSPSASQAAHNAAGGACPFLLGNLGNQRGLSSLRLQLSLLAGRQGEALAGSGSSAPSRTRRSAYISEQLNWSEPLSFSMRGKGTKEQGTATAHLMISDQPGTGGTTVLLTLRPSGDG